jgi:autotransporter family porin
MIAGPPPSNSPGPVETASKVVVGPVEVALNEPVVELNPPPPGPTPGGVLMPPPKPPVVVTTPPPPPPTEVVMIEPLVAVAPAVPLVELAPPSPTATKSTFPPQLSAADQPKTTRNRRAVNIEAS